MAAWTLMGMVARRNCNRLKYNISVGIRNNRHVVIRLVVLVGSEVRSARNVLKNRNHSVKVIDDDCCFTATLCTRQTKWAERLPKLMKRIKDEMPFRVAHAEVRTRVVVICDRTHYQLDYGGALSEL